MFVNTLVNIKHNIYTHTYVYTHKVKCFLIVLCLSLCISCTRISSLHGANGSPVCWFCLALFQWFFLSVRMSALCSWPPPRTLDVISSTWSLHYLLSSTMLPSRCSATWNAWLASSLKTIMKLCAKTLQTVPSLSTLQPCVQEPEKDSSTAAQSKGKQTKHPLADCHPSFSPLFLNLLIQYCMLFIFYRKIQGNSYYLTHKNVGIFIPGFHYLFTSLCRCNFCVCHSAAETFS